MSHLSPRQKLLRVAHLSQDLDLSQGLLSSRSGNLVFETFNPTTSSERLADIEAYRHKVLEEDRATKKIYNYTLDKLNFSEQNYITVAKKEGLIVGFSTIFHSPFYPARSARILNRYYLDVSMRQGKVQSGEATVSMNMVIHQTQVAKSMNLEAIFISTEAYRARWIQTLARTASHYTKEDWRSSEDLFLICNNRSSMGCWQHLTWLSMDKSWQPAFERKSYVEALEITSAANTPDLSAPFIVPLEAPAVCSPAKTTLPR